MTTTRRICVTCDRITPDATCPVCGRETYDTATLAGLADIFADDARVADAYRRLAGELAEEEERINA